MSSETPFPPPTPHAYSLEEVATLQNEMIRVIDTQSKYILQLLNRMKAVEEMLYKFLGIDEQGRIPGMPGYDGPLKEELERYQQLKAQTEAAPVQVDTTGAYL